MQEAVEVVNQMKTAKKRIDERQAQLQEQMKRYMDLEIRLKEQRVAHERATPNLQNENETKVRHAMSSSKHEPGDEIELSTLASSGENTCCSSGGESDCERAHFGCSSGENSGYSSESEERGCERADVDDGRSTCQSQMSTCCASESGEPDMLLGRYDYATAQRVMDVLNTLSCTILDARTYISDLEQTAAVEEPLPNTWGECVLCHQQYNFYSASGDCRVSESCLSSQRTNPEATSTELECPKCTEFWEWVAAEYDIQDEDSNKHKSR